MNPVERTRDTKNAKTSIIKFALLDSIAALLFSLGLYGKYATQNDAFLPFLNDPTNVNTFIVVGFLGMVFCGFKIITLALKREKVERLIQ